MVNMKHDWVTGFAKAMGESQTLICCDWEQNTIEPLVDNMMNGRPSKSPTIHSPYYFSNTRSKSM